MRSRALGYSALFFLSGATGLVYELLWVRLLYQAFGSTIQSVTTVVAAYMGGLGLGAWLLGRRADRHPRPAALYGWLEIAIGAFGILSPLVLGLARHAYIGAAAALGAGPLGSLALRFGLAALVLLVPTTLMGGTLPVLTRALTGTDRAALKRWLGRLYGLNTLGAVIGAGLAGFVLIEHVGIRASLWVTAAVNLGLGAAAIALARPLPEIPATSDPGRQPGEHGARDALHTVALVLLGVTAFASLLDEIAWTRVLVMIVGGSTYAFTLVLVVFLLGIGLGSALVARRSTERAVTAASAGFAQGVTAAGAAALFVFFSWLPLYIIEVFQIDGLGPTARLLLMGIAVGAVVFVPALGMGMTFPLLTDLVARPGEARARDVGAAYALNTVGSILGAALTGFVLVVALGTDRTLRLGLAINAVAALALVALAARGVAEGSPEHRRLRLRVLGGGALGAAALVVALAAPHWSSRFIDLGPTIYGRAKMSPAERRGFLSHAGGRQLAFREGWNATVSVWESAAGRTLKVNGKADASDHGDMDTEILSGLAPVAARPDAASALVIGFGSGVTARTLADVPGMRRVRVVEIEPAVLEVAGLFTGVNDSVLSRPTVSAVVDDARSALQVDASTYDVIVSEPSNPWVAGVATLYTPEFFRILRRRLADNGVFCQWVQLYQLPLPVVATIVANVREVFPHAELWFSSPWDLMVVASPQPIRYDRAWLARLFADPRIGALGRDYLNVYRPEQYAGHLVMGDAGTARLVRRGGAIVHRDDRPQLEFAAARSFLDSGSPGDVFDSLITIGAAADAAAPPEALAWALSARRGDPTGVRYVDAVRRAHPHEDVWAFQAAAMWLSLGDSSLADSALPRLAGTGNRDALLLSGIVAAKRDQPALARRLLRRALAAGADEAEGRAVLAVLAAREQRWGETGAELRRALTAAPRPSTFRRPYPRDWLGDALTPFALDGPAPLADTLLAQALATRPGWAAVYELEGIVAIRLGRCAEAAERFLTLLDFGMERPDGPELVARCRRGLGP